MEAERPYWNMDMELLLNTPEMEVIQLGKLRKMLARLKVKSVFYGRMIDQSGLDPEKIRSFDEFKEKIGIFDKKALMALVAECNGDILEALDRIMPVSVHDLDVIATTTGTTGMPTPYPLTRFDVENMWGEAISRAYWRAGVRSFDRILFCFALSMVVAGVPTLMGMQKIGATILPVGAEAKTERILMTQSLYKGTIFAGTPSLAAHLIEQAPALIGKEAGSLGFKALFCGGEPGAGIPEVKTKLENAYGCRIYDAGAGFGCSCDHDEYQGMHWLGDDLCYYELVDPETKEPVALEHGAVGEAIFTTLEGEGCVQVRQGFGDIHQVFTEPCPCGATGFRYRVIGRLDNMLKVKGIMVYPSHIKGVVNEFVPRVTGELRIILDEKPPRVNPPLKIRIEHSGNVKESDLQILENEIIHAMGRRLNITPRILWAEPGSLERSHYKGLVFEKTYID